MLTTLNTAYIDTRAADLAWCLGREPLPALAVLDLQCGAAAVQLRLLGASHQVLLHEADSSCSETVACIPGSSTPLPLGVSTLVGGREYEFAARVETLSRGSFAGRAQELLALVADHPHGLAGTFPGSPHAFTAMLAQWRGGRLGWRTWHAYPQEGQLVVTRTRVGRCRTRERSGLTGASPDYSAGTGGTTGEDPDKQPEMTPQAPERGVSHSCG